VLEAQGGAGLRAFRDLDGFVALEGGDLHLAAERHGGEVHRDLAEEVVAVAPEELVLVDVDDDVETPGRAPAGAAAGLARLRDDLAGAAALRAGARHREEALLKADLALAFALRTGARR